MNNTYTKEAVMNQRVELQNKIIQKAMEDQSFKKELMADPVAAIAKAFDVKVPAGFKINVVEETATEVYLVLPSADAEKADSNMMW